MVADGGHIVAHLVHDVHDVFALGQGADGAALNGVAVVHQRHGVAQLFEGLLIGREARIADRVLNAAVDVVGVEHYDCRMLHLCLLREGKTGEQHAGNQKHSQQFLKHMDTAFLNIGFHFHYKR